MLPPDISFYIIVFQLHALAQNVAEFAFLTCVFIRHTLYTFINTSFIFFLANYVNTVYLLDPQQLACTPIKLDPLISLPVA